MSDICWSLQIYSVDDAKMNARFMKMPCDILDTYADQRVVILHNSNSIGISTQAIIDRRGDNCLTEYIMHDVSFTAPCGPFYWHGLTLVPPWISYYMPSKTWDGITYPFPNFNRYTVK